jgi:HdeA/HdeB family protein
MAARIFRVEPPGQEERGMNTTVSAALLALCLGACAAQPALSETAAPAAPTSSAAPVAAARPSAPSEAQIAPGRWNVERVRCSDLLEASDADRAAAAMFYYGYLAAKAGIHVIDVSRIDGNVAKVMRQCAATPSLTVPQAFRAALRPRSAHG